MEAAEYRNYIMTTIRNFLDHIPNENEYLRRQGEKLIADIGEYLANKDNGRNAPTGVARQQVDSDDFEWHPGLDLS
jgi:hypothetical protein